VNAVNPTVVNIGMGPHVWSEQLKLADEHKARIPLGKFAGHLLYYILSTTTIGCSKKKRIPSFICEITLVT